MGKIIILEPFFFNGDTAQLAFWGGEYFVDSVQGEQMIIFVYLYTNGNEWISVDIWMLTV